MAKASKDSVDYSRGMADSHCGKVFKDDKGYCKHFIDPQTSILHGECDLVSGGINRVYWCKLFEKAK